MSDVELNAAEDAVTRAARRLAAEHEIGSPRSRQTPLLDNLTAQAEFLRQAHATFTRQAHEETILSSNAAEWVLDNFYIVQQALNLIETDMPPSYYRELPVLSAGTWQGYPRVYDLARALIAQQNARIARVPLDTFVHAYQDVQPLRTGEIWALPVMLRIGIVETLTHAVASVLGATPPPPTLPPVDVSVLPADTLVGNCVLSLRMLANEDWKDFFERVSPVEQTLAEDPTGVYPRMDFETRDRYRKEVEALARATDHNEVDVARQAIQLAQQDVGIPPGEQDRLRHVGYYLVDAGRPLLEDHLHYVPSLGTRLRRFFYRDRAPVTYIGGIGLLTLLLLLLLLGYARVAGAGPLIVVLVALVTVIPAITFATGLVNWLITSSTPPRLLPKFSYEDGVPEDARSMVVVPTLLADVDDVDPLLRELEQHYLRNADDNVFFGLLTDFTDAPTQDQPEDVAIVRAAADGIRALNQRYRGEPFYLFHRRRLWNEQEGVWMGWERKRGKLEEFNRLLLDQGDTTYVVQVGDLARLPSIRFVITLDEDTVLPRDAARRLIGALAHPLNCPRFDDKGEVSAGYTLLQPRTEIKPVSATRSRFTRIFSGISGLDLYTYAVSDIYQDLFGEGIYVGKGIYDVHALARSLDGRIPENALLSHDLFEGILGRAALVTDVVLYEDYPADYLTFAHRRHRWIRGDWQLLPWLRRQVPQRTPEPAANPLSFIDRWKVLDNLRRSLDAPATLLWLLAAWLWLPGAPLVWTVFTLLFSAGTLVSTLFGAILRGVGDGFGRDLRRQLVRWLITLTFLPYEAISAVHAIIVVIWRLFFTRRHLLQWTTAARAQSLFGRSNPTLLAWRHMIGSPLVALAVGAAIVWIRPGALAVALPFLVAWMFAPQLAVWLSRRAERPAAPLRPADVQELRNVARSTWLYFEQFMGPVDHWLPPDHYQEDPRGVVAHRTSPTNIGLGLLSTLAAYDLGYVGMWELTVRLENSLQALDELEQYRGHLLNWYDTRTQKPLPPRYVSSVDSGNLAACLIVLRQGMLDLPNVVLPRWERWQGLVDTLAMLDTAIDDLSATAPETMASLKEQIFQMRTQTLDRQDHPEQWTPLLTSLAEDAWPRFEAALVGLLEQHSPPPAVLQRVRIWTERARHDLFDMQRRIGALVPWLRVFEDAPPVLRNSVLHNAGESPLAQAWTELVTLLPQRARVGDIADLCNRGRRPLDELRRTALHAALSPEEIATVHDWCDLLSTRLDESCAAVTRLLESAQRIADRCQQWIDGMNFAFLYDKQRRVFRIGYNVDAETPDPNYYDLLASESRSTSLIAIAKGDVPQSHWLHLGRPVTQVNGGRALMSWSGTMFEYLMPILWTRQYPNTLLYESTHAAVHAQRAYAAQKRVPWGISESGYYRFDAAMNYQYRAFGAPQLGFKRGLEEDTVVAPYASLLALQLYPAAVMDNLKRLRDLGMWGDYGFYEAIDFTPSRLALGQESARVRSFMVHHQGMILLAALNALNDDLMVRRFHADPRIQSVELLLQERIPSGDTLDEARAPEEEALLPVARPITAQPWSVPVDTPMPQAHFLSNGRYGVLVTNAGGGFSRWQETDLTRWRADTTCDDWGTWIYVQDLGSENQDEGALWSAAVQPMIDGHVCDVTFAPHKVDFQCERQRITTHTEVTVPPEDDLEIRRVRVTNQSDEPRRLRLVSYAEIVLGQQDTDRRHPAFNKMFIQGDYAADQRTLIFTRRPRSHHEEPPFFGHAVVVEAGRHAVVHYETDRDTFLGRNGSLNAPAALLNGGLTNNAGPVLDPIAALSVEIELEPHTTATLAFLSAAGANRADVLTAIEKYRDWPRLDRSFRLAEAQSEVEMRQLEVDGDALLRFQQLLSLLLYPSAALRADVAQLTANTLGQSGLWPYAISGDYPILLARIHGEDHLPLARELLQAHTYWRNRGLKIDLVLVNEEAVGYNQELQGQLRRLLDRMNSDHWLNRRGGIFLLQRGVMSAADQNLLAAAARVVIDGERGGLETHLRNALQQPSRLPAFVPARDDYDRPALAAPTRPADLQFDNGWGGFSDQGCEYVIYRRPDDPTPAPWINVIANPDFGFIVSETGGGYTWAGNSGENRLTPWSNDPVLDRPGEALYLRDEETAAIWSPTPNPAGAETPHLIRHGAGYSVFESCSHGLEQCLRLYTVPDAPLKLIHLRLRNRWEHTRRLTATYYAEWVLGVNRDQMQQYIVPEYAPGHNALLARNPYNAEFGGRVAFLAACDEPHGVTTDRTEFLGRLGDLRRPAALTRVGLAGTVRPAVDPCAAIQLHVDLQPGEEREIYFVLGQGEDREDALRLIERVRTHFPDWDAARGFWDDFLDAVHVETPDAAMNVLLNRWLPYQNASCRVWGRSAFYQSSGAYGFRDQLQDVGALLHHAPQEARRHILRAARHQFDAGDVLHWWHPPSGRGVRTRISDDLLWLPYITAHYVHTTGDASILDEEVPFRLGDPLAPDEEERYSLYELSDTATSLYEHCCRALSRGATAGRHGLPLMGAGDWNDGMNRVGIEGKGESVWLGWFLYAAFDAFLPIAQGKDDQIRVAAFGQKMTDLRAALHNHAWDGDWYLRAFYDDGSLLGSSTNRECRIDSIAQSWSVLSGAGDAERSRRALAAVDDVLVSRDEQLIRLFTPAFDKTPRDPGYIKGYPPGIRENGGQYTHAAIWAVWSYAALGDGDRAGELFRLLNPVLHSDTRAKAAHYRVEPYIIAADVYGVAPFTGRGGWTWYTGSGGWYYRLGTEAILGLRRQGTTLRLDPCIPRTWDSYRITYRFGRTTYMIDVENPEHVNRGVAAVLVDGEVSVDGVILCVDDGVVHRVLVRLGSAT